MSLNYFKHSLPALDFAKAMVQPLKLLAEPLFLNTSITNFSYLKFEADGSVVNLSTDINWIEYRFNENIKYQILFKEQLQDNQLNKPHIYLWPNHVNNNLLGALHSYGIWNGCNVYIPQPNKIEVYSFTTGVENCNIKNFYINNFDFLNRFILYISNYIKPLLSKKDHSNNIKTDLILPPYHKKINDKKNSLFLLKKIQLDSKITLTQKEINCCFYLSKGLSVKAIANKMYLSPRTVETHIKNIKLKTNCITTDLLIEYVQQKKWIFDSLNPNYL
ncbi:MAG: helix-turn-helix transcriptional regulator [Legionella sp.]|nr:helix-turn-helix transcriptional regulator [Legionella sp.]